MAKATSAEGLLDAEGGPYKLVETDTGEDSEMSPLEAHMRARKNVHPANTKSASAYTRKYNPAEEEGHVRVLSLEPADGSGAAVAEVQYAAAETPVAAEEKKSSHPVPGHKPFVAGGVDNIPPPSPKLEKAAVSDVHLAQGGTSIENIRFGDHPGKTRIVIDVSETAKFSHHLSDENKVLDINISGAAWGAGIEAKILQHPLILGYRATTDANGTHLTLKLKKPGKVVWSAALKPDHGKGDRVVFDIAAL
ncbi:MAG TPA: hypothetical protein DEA55_08840 [Rhodospirillaceae bacterium]|nr:hypothetical protein [Rhodospirillaceae bacterium]